MKFKRKKVCIASTVLLALVLLFPLKFEYKDGGTKEYAALLYSITYKKKKRKLFPVFINGLLYTYRKTKKVRRNLIH